MGDSKEWGPYKFVVLYGGIGLGVSAWCLTQIVYYFLLHTVVFTSTSIISFFGLILIGFFVIFLKMKQGKLQAEYEKERELIAKDRHRLIIKRTIKGSLIMLILCLLISYSLGYFSRVDLVGSILAYILLAGIIYCWQLWAIYCCRCFFGAYEL
jgi:ABC-type spermidine/putrescine transport system permease subunit I